jgi:uncharacterized coiled-coil protein SlyX
VDSAAKTNNFSISCRVWACLFSAAQGQPESVHYDQVNAMLLNEFLKEHRHVQEQDATIARQQKQIHALTAGLQQVSAQLEASKTATQVAESNY